MDVAVRQPPRTPILAAVWAELRRMPRIPLIIMVVVVLVALLAPLLATYPVAEGDLAKRLKAPSWLADGAPGHILGTDYFGRDVYSRLVFGARVSFSVSIVGLLLAGIAGTAIGLISGYFGGWIDAVWMRLADVGMAFPYLVLAVLLAVVLGASYTNVLVIVGVLLWPRYARQVRGECLAIKEQDFVALARVAGCSHIHIMLRHIFPNVVPTLLVLLTLQVGWVIIMESSMSFLGVGIPPPEPSWGVMVADGRGYLASAWWISFFPGLAIFLTVMAMNLLGDWARDRLDPKLRQV